MKPDGLEAIRGIQRALMVAVAPELQTPFAQDTLQTVQMLLESLAGEWDTAAATLQEDNQRLLGLLHQAQAALKSVSGPDSELATLAADVESGLAGLPEASLALSRLRVRNDRLRALLERCLVAFEDAHGRPQAAALMPVRDAMYRHLREVAARGWSFWDAASFRERMARLRSGD